MNRYALATLYFVAVFLATEFLRFSLEGQLAPWLGGWIGEVFWQGYPGHSVLGYVLVSAMTYAVVYWLGAAVLGTLLRAHHSVYTAGALLSGTYLVVRVQWGGLMPIGGGFTEEPLWMHIVDWANWWAPPLASVSGALLADRMRRNEESASHSG